MAQGYDTEEQKERVLLVGVQLDNQEDMESSLEELKALAKTAGAETVGKVIQPRDAYHPATYIGKGKLEEVRSLIEQGQRVLSVTMNFLRHNLGILKMHWGQRLWTEPWSFSIFLLRVQRPVKERYRLR